MSKEILALKEKEVAEIKEKIEKARSIVMVDYRGLTVFEDTQLRRSLRKENIEYKVIKNRIMLRALRETGYEGFDSTLEGPTAIAFGYDDAVMPAKILSDTAKKYNKMKLKGGVVEGKKLDEKEIVSLAKMPSKPVLVAQLLGLLTSPMRGLAVACSEIAKQKA